MLLRYCKLLLQLQENSEWQIVVSGMGSLIVKCRHNLAGNQIQNEKVKGRAGGKMREARKKLPSSKRISSSPFFFQNSRKGNRKFGVKDSVGSEKRASAGESPEDELSI